ncbi:head completion/stabilization protein [Paraburkholderia hospita]|nr:head completion/stabilization protein [Paraburkholderia hospita]
MSSFSAVQAPNAAALNTPLASQIIEQDWFPNVDISHVRKAVRLTGTVTDERLQAALVRSMGEVNSALATWQAPYVATGIASLADVPAPKIGGESVHLSRYRDAVYYLARANMVEQYRDYDTTADGNKEVETVRETVDSDRRIARNALNDIRGTARMSVELV